VDNLLTILNADAPEAPFQEIPSADPSVGNSTHPKVFVETYGCQMNVSDSEIVLGVLKQSGYERADRVEDADVVLLNTCAIRDNT